MKEITNAEIKNAWRLQSGFSSLNSFEQREGLWDRLGFTDAPSAWANNPWCTRDEGGEGRVVFVASGLDMRYVDYRERFFCEFHVQEGLGNGPGWFIYGRHKTEYRTPESTGGIVMLCGRPNVPRRAHPHYNIKVRRGWDRKADAQFVCDLLNAGYTCQPRNGATIYGLTA